MDDRTQLGTRILKETKGLLAQMAADDLRSLSKELEWLITQEHDRRQREWLSWHGVDAPAKLVDTRADARREAEKETG